MQTKWTWFERHFDFNFPAEKMPDVMERLRGTPLRAAALVDGIPTTTLHQREGNSWSIQENVAHIADLETLWIGRIEDIIANHETMREADLTNATTFGANHHDRSIADVLRTVEEARLGLLREVEALEVSQWGLSSMHPRLKQPMRIVDLCLFVAEHDDYHLARARYLKQQFAR